MKRSRFGDAYVLVDGGFEDQLRSEECLNLSADLLVEVLGLRFILHLLSTRIDNLRGRPPAIEFEAFVLDRGIWSGVVRRGIGWCRCREDPAVGRVGAIL